METTAMVAATLVLVPALGLLIWAWRALAEVNEAMRTFNGYDGMHYED